MKLIHIHSNKKAFQKEGKTKIFFVGNCPNIAIFKLTLIACTDYIIIRNIL
jgi:hypothetical protein